ncbi:MAG: GGDEF domain-containing protein [Burkholderiales bacterium]|nr:GGDEF domain-containing protein [Burkholderiales bacterium]
MQNRYPDVNEELYRLHYLKQDRAQSRKLIRVVMWATLPLAYVDFSFLGTSQQFYSLFCLRLLLFVYSWYLLKASISTANPQQLDRQILRWSAAVLLMQFVSNASLPRDYFGHYLVDAWICMIYFVTIPLPLKSLRPAMLAYLVALLVLLAYKVIPTFAYVSSVVAILLASAYTGHATSAYLQRYRKKILSAELELDRQESTDPATGVANRREFMRVSESELQRHIRFGKSLSMLILDLNHFKQILDEYGAPAGDVVLIEVTRRLKRATRSYDCMARYGTEEFSLLLPEANAEDANKVANRILSTIAAMPVAMAGQEIKISATVGIATMQEGDTQESLLDRATAALKSAKNVNLAPGMQQRASMAA